MGEAWVRVEQYRTAICCNIDHRELIGELRLVLEGSVEDEAPCADEREPLRRGHGERPERVAEGPLSFQSIPRGIEGGGLPP